tara:strand:+ start:405 stop:1061 length:657 start_codon:yes stop_codon:yes gene_type:complete
MPHRGSSRPDKPNIGPSNLLLDRLTRILNRTIELDDRTRYRIAELGNCSIAFKLRNTDARVLVTIFDDNLWLSSDTVAKPDVQIEAGLADFIAMARTQRSGKALATGKVEIQGDLATAQLIQTLIAEATFDWEELISTRTGDVLARQIGRGVRRGARWMRATGKILECDIKEYLHYETRLLPTDREIKHFIQEGASVVAGTERLQARITRLQRRREQT